jgi:osmoprotectant transport system permease protein
VLPVPADRPPSGRALRLTLGAIALAGLALMPWVTLAPNRLLPGQGLSALAALGPGAWLVGGLVAAAALAPLAPIRPGWRLALALAAAAGILAATGLCAERLLAGRPSAARVSLGAGFWIAGAALLLLALEEARALARRGAASGTVAAVAGLVGLVGAAGVLDRLSLAVELRARGDAVLAALGQHLALSAAALALALALALPLGWAAFRSPRAEAAVSAALGAVQVVPALALFGLLIPLLAALLRGIPSLRDLGLGAIGPTPAILGVGLYLALPLVRGLVSGLRAADPDAVEAARAMGMGEARITAEMRIPLSLPVLAGALRVAAVQSIGLVTLGGLIGAGGLGAVVFEGMSQLAPDLILLGALPIVALALIADALLGVLPGVASAPIADAPLAPVPARGAGV